MAHCEVIESIVHHGVDKHRLDATTHAVRLPDLLLRECEHEIQRVSTSLHLVMFNIAPCTKCLSFTTCLGSKRLQ